MKKSNTAIAVCEYLYMMLLCLSCGNSFDSRLIAAEDIMEEDADSAYSILSNIKQADILTDDERAKYALLRTQALIKLDTVLTDDTTIKEALEFYSGHKHTPDYMKSLFYTAWIQNTKQDYYDAMHNATEAYDIAVGAGDIYWTAKGAELISLIFLSDHNYKEAAKFSELAAMKYKNCGRELNHAWCLMDAASAYSGYHRSDSALSVLSRIPEPRNRDDSIVWVLSLDVKLLTYFNERRYAEADSVIDLRFKFQNYYPADSYPYYIRAIINSCGGKLNDVPYYLYAGDSLSNVFLDSIAASRAYMSYAAARGKYKEAVQLADTMFMLCNHMISSANENMTSLAQRDYYTEKLVREQIKAERRKNIVGAVIIIAIILFLAALVLYKMKIRMSRMELTTLASEMLALNQKHESQISELNRTLSDKDSKISNLQNQMRLKQQDEDNNLSQIIYLRFSASWRRITAISRHLLDSSDIKSQEVTRKNLQKEISQLKSDQSYYVIERLVNEHKDNIMLKARRDLRNLNERELRLLCLIVSGIEAEFVCAFYGISRNSIGPMRTRLRKRIQDSQSENLAEYLEMI